MVRDKIRTGASMRDLIKNFLDAEKRRVKSIDDWGFLLLKVFCLTCMFIMFFALFLIALSHFGAKLIIVIPFIYAAYRTAYYMD